MLKGLQSKENLPPAAVLLFKYLERGTQWSDMGPARKGKSRIVTNLAIKGNRFVEAIRSANNKQGVGTTQDQT